MNQSLNDQILINYGGTSRNSLLNIIQEHTDETENIIKLSPSTYISHDDLKVNMNVYNDGFSILSLNCQSLSAKYGIICVFIEDLKHNGFEFSALCFQETWLHEDCDTSLYQLENYNFISQGSKCSKHGGLAVYLHKNYT